MAHFKRKGPKSTRAGCLLCKPHKRQGVKLSERRRFGELRRLEKFVFSKRRRSEAGDAPSA